MQRDSPTRRPYGSGHVHQKHGSWYGRWRVGDHHFHRKLGPVRQTGSREGLTKAQAEKALRQLQEQTQVAPTGSVQMTFEQAAQHQLDRREAKGLKPRSIEAAESDVRVHLVPFFGQRPLDKITSEDIQEFVLKLTRMGLSAKSIHNYVSTLHSIFELGTKRSWVVSNACKGVELPRVVVDPQTRYLDGGELEAVLAATPDDALGKTEGVLYFAAASTGARQGELFALQWQHVDWLASRIRVERNYSRGKSGTPKSGIGRSVPMGRRLAQELERHFQRSVFQGEEDLVFPHPATGTPLDSSKILKRFKAACRRAGVRPARFHDLRHTFGTHMAKVTNLRDVQEWMGHREFKTTERYAAFMPGARDAELVDQAFGEGTVTGTNVSEPKRTEEVPDALG